MGFACSCINTDDDNAQYQIDLCTAKVAAVYSKNDALIFMSIAMRACFFGINS